MRCRCLVLCLLLSVAFVACCCVCCLLFCFLLVTPVEWTIVLRGVSVIPWWRRRASECGLEGDRGVRCCLGRKRLCCVLVLVRLLLQLLGPGADLGGNHSGRVYHAHGACSHAGSSACAIVEDVPSSSPSTSLAIPPPTSTSHFLRVVCTDGMPVMTSY